MSVVCTYHECSIRLTLMQHVRIVQPTTLDLLENCWQNLHNKQISETLILAVEDWNPFSLVFLNIRNAACAGPATVMVALSKRERGAGGGGRRISCVVFGIHVYQSRWMAHAIRLCKCRLPPSLSLPLSFPLLYAHTLGKPRLAAHTPHCWKRDHWSANLQAGSQAWHSSW